MVVFVVLHNFLLGIAFFIIARRIWQFRRRVAVISDRILAAERSIHRVLEPAPRTLHKAQVTTSYLRDRYQQLGIQYERVQKIISILSLMQLFLRYGRMVMPRSPQDVRRK